MNEAPSKSQLLICQSEDGRTRLDVRFEGETVWLTQPMMADISMHLKNFTSEDGQTRVEVRFARENVWLTQKLMAEHSAAGGASVRQSHRRRGGVRDGTDVEAELRFARFLDELRPGTNVVWIRCEAELQHLSSSAIRELNAIEPAAGARYVPESAEIYALPKNPDISKT